MKKVIEIDGNEWVPADTEYHYDNDVMIREMVAPVAMYAVFDEGEKVSKEFGPLNDVECINFAEGYAECKKNYNEN